MSVAVWSGSLLAWERELAALKERISVRPVGSASDGRGFPGRAFVGRGAQDRLASGRAGGPGAALPHPVTAGAQSLGGRCSAGSRARLRDRGAWGRGRGSGYRRDGVREEGRALG